MPRTLPEIERDPKRLFSASQRHQIRLQQATDGICRCAVCDEVIATLDEDGGWDIQRPHEFDHIEPHNRGGRTLVVNGRAVCGHPHQCHKTISAEGAKELAKAMRRAGVTGQYARRKARKSRGEKPLLQGRGFDRP